MENKNNMKNNNMRNSNNKKNNKSKKCKSKKISIQKYIIKDKPKSVLIVENMQNCFFTGGSMGFINKLEEKNIVENVNRLINLEILDDMYVNSSLTGLMKEGIELEKELGKNRKGIKSTGARKKYFFDYVVFTQTANLPDHWSFASHQYLRSLDYKYFTEYNKTRKSYLNCNEDAKDKCKGQFFLLPDHAITDGSDKFILNGKEVKGIDFHPDLDTSSLYRPNEGIRDSAFINKPEYHNRGFIITKGSENRAPYSAFKNTLNETTCLDEFLKKNEVNNLYVCGIGRENTIKRTLLDSLKFKFIRERTIIYDSTMPILVSPLTKKDEDAKRVDMENEWCEKLEEKGIMIKPTNFFLSLEKSIKNTRIKTSEKMEGFLSMFGNTRRYQPIEYNKYMEKVEPRKKKKKITKKNNKK